MSLSIIKSFTAILCFFSISLFAQETLNEVNVITTKLPQKENQLAKSVTILSDSVIRMHAGWSVSELLQKQTGISIAGATQTPGSLQSIFMRGGNVGHTLLLMDGMPLYDPSTIESNFDLNLINLENIERIEIIRGGQSTLYGSDAVSGVINFITKKEANSAFKPSFKFNYGSFNVINSSGSASGKLKGVVYNLAANTFHSNGFSSAVSDLAMPEKDGFQKNNYEANLTKMVGALSVSVFGRYTAYTSDLDGGANVDELDYVLSSKNFQYGAVLDFQKQSYALHLKVNSSFISRTFENDSTFISPSAFDNYSISNFESKSDFIDLFGNFSLNSHVNLLIGADLRKQSIAQSYMSLGAFGPFEDIPLLHNEASITNSSIYSTINLAAENGLGVELGSRVNFHSVYGSNISYNVNPFWRLNKLLTAYGVYGTSFKNPSLYQLYSPYGNLELTPENVKSFDLGFKYDDRNIGSQASIAYFQRNHENKIGFVNLNQPPYGGYENIDWQNARGLEISLSKVFDKFSTSSNYTFLIGKFGSNGYEGENLLRRPKHQVNLSADYALSEKLNLSLNYQYQSARHDAFYDNNTFSTVEVLLDPFHLINFSSRYNISKSFSVFGTVQNVINQKYTEIYGYNSAPINFRLGITYN